MWIVENAECKNITEIIYKRIRYMYVICRLGGYSVSPYGPTYSW